MKVYPFLNRLYLLIYFDALNIMLLYINIIEDFNVLSLLHSLPRIIPTQINTIIRNVATSFFISPQLTFPSSRTLLDIKIDKIYFIFCIIHLTLLSDICVLVTKEIHISMISSAISVMILLLGFIVSTVTSTTLISEENISSILTFVDVLCFSFPCREILYTPGIFDARTK